MSGERIPVTVEARFLRDGAVVPLAVEWNGRGCRVAMAGRCWEEGGRQCFDVQLDTGETLLLCLERRSLRWYVTRRRGRAQMV